MVCTVSPEIAFSHAKRPKVNGKSTRPPYRASAHRPHNPITPTTRGIGMRNSRDDSGSALHRRASERLIHLRLQPLSPAMPARASAADEQQQATLFLGAGSTSAATGSEASPAGCRRETVRGIVAREDARCHCPRSAAAAYPRGIPKCRAGCPRVRPYFADGPICFS